MKRILAIILSVIIATCAFAQEHLEFMGIPMENEFLFKCELEQKNFHLFNGGVFNLDMKSEDLGDKGFIIVHYTPILQFVHMVFVQFNPSKTEILENLVRKYKKYQVPTKNPNEYKFIVRNSNGQAIGDIECELENGMGYITYTDYDNKKLNELEMAEFPSLSFQLTMGLIDKYQNESKSEIEDFIELGFMPRE